MNGDDTLILQNQEQENILKDMKFCHLEKRLSHGNYLLDADTKRGLEALKTVTKKIPHKVTEKKEKKYWMNY